MTKPSDYMTVSETADALRVSRKTVRRWIHERQLPAVQPGRKLLIPRIAVAQLLDRRG